MQYDIVEKLKKEIQGFRAKPGFESVGRVVEVGDGIAKVEGLEKALSQELLFIETENGEIAALAFNLEENFIGIVALGEGERIKIGDRVRSSGRVLSIPVGDALLGRVVDPLGHSLDGKGVIFKSNQKPKEYPLERSAPSVVQREGVRIPLHTGIAAIDSMIPIGRGQRELIIGDRQTGKTSIALDAILNQQQDAKDNPVICIYVAVGQKNSKIANIIKILDDAGALAYTIIVSAPASAPAALQYLAPFAGAAIGEYFMDQGRDALVIYDDLSKHAASYRELSLLLRRPPGREAFPGDIFYLHSRLLERAAKLSKEFGGGSLTALPIIETQLGDVSAYIPTNVISITDGQIYLESNLFYQGIRPAINVGLSVSRVGSSAQTKAMKQVAGKLRLELAQFRALEAFVQFASDLDEATQKKIKRGRLLVEILKQTDREPVPFERQVALLYAALGGFFDTVPLDQISKYKIGFLEYCDARYREALFVPLRESKTLDESLEKQLVSAITEYMHTASEAR